MNLSEWLVIFIVALVVLGPERLPSACRYLGKAWGQSRELLQQLYSEWQALVDEQQLADRENRAKSADKIYSEKTEQS